MRSKPLLVACLITGCALVLATQALFSPTLAAQPWFAAHKSQIVAGFIIGSCVLYGTLVGLLMHALHQENRAGLP